LENHIGSVGQGVSRSSELFLVRLIRLASLMNFALCLAIYLAEHVDVSLLSATPLPKPSNFVAALVRWLEFEMPQSTNADGSPWDFFKRCEGIVLNTF
jgi:hypothetical protein